MVLAKNKTEHQQTASVYKVISVPGFQILTPFWRVDLMEEEHQ